MATKPPPLPPDARRPKRTPHPPPRPAAVTQPPVDADAHAEPDTDPDNPPPAPPHPDAYPPAPTSGAPWSQPAGVADGQGGDVEVVNRSDGGFFYWLLRFYAFGLLCAL